MDCFCITCPIIIYSKESFFILQAKFVIKAGVDILGISAEVDIDVGDKGIRFTVEGSLFGIATASLTVKTPYVKDKKLEESNFMVNLIFRY